MKRIELKFDYICYFKNGMIVYFNNIDISKDDYIKDKYIINLKVVKNTIEYDIESVFDVVGKEHYFYFENCKYYLNHENKESVRDFYFTNKIDNTDYNFNAKSAKYIVEKLYNIFDEDYVNNNIISIDYKNRDFRVRKEFRSALELKFKDKAKDYIRSIRLKSQEMDDFDFIELMYNEYRRDGYGQVGLNLWNIRKSIKSIKKDKLTFLNLGNYVEFIKGEEFRGFCKVDIF